MTAGKTSRKKFKSALLSTMLGLTLAACGHENKVYRDPTPPVAPPSASGNLASPLPNGFFDESVNLASSRLGLDGTSSTSLAILLETRAGTSSTGGFNGTGTGNRAILGLTMQSAKKLNTLGSGITFDVKAVSGSAQVGISLLVDLDCSGASTRVLSASASDLAPGTAQAAGYTRMSAGFSENRWLASGSAITDPGNPGVTLVPASGAAVALNDLLTQFPNVCLRNAINTDDQLPKGLAVGGVLFTLGDSSTTTLNQSFINRITVGSDIYESSSWGSL